MNPAEREWPLNKLSILEPQRGVYMNNITLKILLQKCSLIVLHGTKPLIQIPLSAPNLVVKSQASTSSFYVHAAGKKCEEKFRFRVLRFQFDEIQEVLSRFVRVVQAVRSSQEDLFCSQNSQLTFSQSSNYDHCASQGSMSEFSQPPTNHLYNQYPLSPASNGGWHSPVSAQPAPYSAVKLNPYASSYEQDTTSSNGNVQTMLDDGPKFFPLKLQKPVVAPTIDQGCQTDPQTYDEISPEELTSLIGVLTADKSFQIFVQRVCKAMDDTNPDQQAHKSDVNEAPPLEPPSAKRPKLEQDTSTDEGQDSLAETLAKVDRILNSF